MRKDRIFAISQLQLLLILGLIGLSILHIAGSLAWWILCVLLLILTCWIIQQRFEFYKQQKRYATALKRANDGHLNTRLLSEDIHFSNEVIFAINQLIEKLDDLQVQTLKSEAAKRQLLSDFSHDLRTPLTSIIGYVDAIKDGIGVSEAEKQSYIEIILNKAQILKALIEEIFDLAKLDADEMPLKMEKLDFAEITREVVIGFMPELHQNEIKISAEIPDKRCLIYADRLSLQRIIGNIIKNATEYGKSGGVLGLDLMESEKDYQLDIWDQGQGIIQEDIKFVFERLYRADRSRNSINRGSGLGLAIAKVLVEKNGGRIWVTSSPGEKTIFSITLPKPGTKKIIV
jgi:signal transduction histidine kinase